MKTHAKKSIELDHLNLTRETKTEVSNLIQSLLTQAQNELKLLEAKNQALTLELAHLRRIRYGVKSEALSQPQLGLFEEDWQTEFRPLRQKSSNCRFQLFRRLSVHALGASRCRITCQLTTKPSKTLFAPSRSARKLAVHRLRARRETCCRHPNPTRHR